MGISAAQEKTCGEKEESNTSFPLEGLKKIRKSRGLRPYEERGYDSREEVSSLEEL